jgi:ABC-type bacteriocin/lantibiotic exporter with double-glycine peptidase domain
VSLPFRRAGDLVTRRLPFAALVLALCPGCTLFVSVPPLEPLPRFRFTLRRVACVPQESETDCGPAALATVLRYYGSRLTLDDLQAEMKERKGGGTTVVEMLFTARKHGFPIEMKRGDINQLRRSVLVGEPLILLLQPLPAVYEITGQRRAHYVVAVGYDDPAREVVLHNGDRAFARLSYNRLQIQWGRAGFLALLVGPKEREPPKNRLSRPAGSGR